MRDIEKIITPFVEAQFPSFYEEEGPLFVLFVKEYYNWLSTQTYLIDGVNVAGAALYHSRALPDYRDIDKTAEDYLIYFKEKYLKGVNFNSLSSRRTLIKAAHDLFKSKGSSLSIELLFSLVFGITIEIYTPGDDVIKCSNAKWVIPKYLEVTPTSKSALLAGKQVTGTKSGASAFVEYVITRSVYGRYIDILFLSSIDGEFVVNDIITSDGIIENAPRVTGSFNSINITEAGEKFVEGEEVNITSATGINGIAYVNSVNSATGLVRFAIIDGGWGYSTLSNTVVSDKVLLINNITNANTSITSFEKYETVGQNNFSVVLNNVIGDFSTGTLLTNHAGALSAISSKNQTTGSNAATLVINPISGTTFANTIVYAANNAFIFTNTSVTFNVGGSIVQSNGTSNTATGAIKASANVTIIDINTATISANGLHVGNYVLQATTLAKGRIVAIPREVDHVYTSVSKIAVSVDSGTFDNTTSLSTYSDSTYTTFVASATPTTSRLGYKLELEYVSGTSRWSSGNTVLLKDSPSTNNVILLSADLGGKYSSNTSYPSTGKVIGSNSTAIGIVSVSNTFYGTGLDRIWGSTSNTFANVSQVSTGTGADFLIGTLSDSETVLLSPDLISGNNDGPGSNSTTYNTMLISGANSTYGNLSSIYIKSGGTGYSNTDKGIITSGAISFSNTTIVTDASGTILSCTLGPIKGTGVTTTPTITIANSTGGTSTGSGADLTPVSSLGFPKSPLGDITYTILDLLRFESRSIGTITSLTAINPGENYNLSPFVSIEEPYVSAYGKRDFKIDITSLSVATGYTVGELITQSLSTPSIQIISNNYTGNTSSVYDVGEYVTTNNGINITGTGTIYSTSFSSPNYTTILTGNTGTFSNTISTSKLTVSTNTGFSVGDAVIQGAGANGVVLVTNTSTMIIRNVSGTFQANSTKVTGTGTSNATISAVSSNFKVYQMFGNTTKGVTDISNTSASTTNSFARGRIKESSNLSVLFVKRISLFTEFVPGYLITGSVSGCTANVVSAIEDSSSNIIGLNANVTANVVTTVGSVSGLSLVDSGLSFAQDQAATFASTDGTRVGSGKINIGGIGTGKGYYATNNGLLDDLDYIHDGEYYQEFSYEIQSTKPFETYYTLLKQLLHVAGTKMFGKVVTSSENDILVDVAESSRTITS